MRPIEIGLVDHTDSSKRFVEGKIQNAITALNIQIAQLRKCWTMVPPAIVFEMKDLKDPESGPPGVWPIILMDALAVSANGFHTTAHCRPYAQVAVIDEHWTITASHEMLEMLVDPSGNRLHVGRSIELGAGHHIADGNTSVEYVLEICDPCAARDLAYRVNDTTWVSDFVTPDFFAPAAIKDAHYTFRHNIKSPRRVIQGGYISWVHSEGRHAFMQQMTWLGSRTPVITEKSAVAIKHETPNLRAISDAKMGRLMHEHAGQVRKPSGRQAIAPGETTRAVEHKQDHWVTFHCDGIIERTVWETGHRENTFTSLEPVKAHEPVKRYDGTNQIVRNVGTSPIFFDKDPISPR
jgi:hypothetical protein